MRILCVIMGIFDIIVGIIILIALINGWRKGLIVQICSIVAIVGGIWLAAEFGGEVGEMFGVEARYAKVAGFLTIFLLALILLAVLSSIIKKLFKFVGLGFLDSIFGGLLSVAKAALILGVLCAAFNALNGEDRFVDKKSLDDTIFFRPLCRTIEVFDLFDVEQAGKVLEDSVKKSVDNIDV